MSGEIERGRILSGFILERKSRVSHAGCAGIQSRIYI
jgi:hypothetical protein